MRQLTNNQIILGINGGHGKASARLFRIGDDACVPFEFDYSLNIHAVDEHETESRLDDFLSRIALDISLTPDELKSQLASVVIAFPGAGLTHDQRHCRRLVEKALPNVEVTIVDDTWAGLYSHTVSPLGMCAFAGAGASVSIATGKFSTEKAFKIDGWGPVIGDFGSAFHLVTKYFRGLNRRRDQDIECPLFPLIQSFCENRIPIPSIDEVQPWFDEFVTQPEWRANFAALAEPILNIADSRPSGATSNARNAARKLVVCTAKSMYHSIDLAIRRYPQKMPIILQGGVFRNSRLYSKTVRRLVWKKHRRKATLATRRPVDGALLLAAEPFGLQDQIVQMLDKQP